jgi:hypothetical protein
MKLKARDIVKGWPKPRSIVRFPAGNRFLVNDARALADHLENVYYHERQQQIQDLFFAAWRAMPPRDPLDFTYFPSELRTFPIFMESLEETSLEEIVGHYARQPIRIAGM